MKIINNKCVLFISRFNLFVKNFINGMDRIDATTPNDMCKKKSN